MKFFTLFTSFSCSKKTAAKTLVALSVAASVVSTADAQSWQERAAPVAEDFYYDLSEDLYSQHLDVPRHPAYIYSGLFSPETQFGPYGKTDIAEAFFDFNLFKDDDFLMGYIDLHMFAGLTYFLENPDMSNLPDALLAAGIDLGMCWRFQNGWSMEVRAAPGIYSDITTPKFGVPLTLNYYFAVDPTLSIQLGGTLRPGWDIPLIPNVGIAWQPNEELRLELGVPKTRITFLPEYMISPFAAFEWRDTTYGMSGKDGVPDSLTLDDMMISGGLTICPMRTWTLSAEYGKFLQRELSASVAEDNAIKLSKEVFFRICIKGEF